MKQFAYILLLVPLLLAFTPNSLKAQEPDSLTKEEVDPYKEFDLYSFKDAQVIIKDSTELKGHLFGVKYGVGLTDVVISTSIEHKALSSPKNIGLYYVYLHNLWSRMPYFGFEVGLEYSEIGTKMIWRDQDDEIVAEDKYLYDCIQLQMMTQFRKDFWKMRLYLNAGPYAYWLKSNRDGDEFSSDVNKLGGGIMGGLGAAFKFGKFELHVEGNIKFAFSNFLKPQFYDPDQWIYTQPLQITGNVGLFYRFGKVNKNK